MAKVKFTSALKRFFPELSEMEVEANNVRELVAKLESEIPGLENYLLEDDGQLRKHVNIFLKDEMISDREKLSDSITPSDEILIYQALSGG